MIILVNIASEFRGVETLKRPPSGLLYVGGALKKAGYPVRILHVSSLKIAEAAQEIAAIQPLFVGVSLFTGLVARYSAQLSREIKRMAPHVPIVWGGVHPSLLPEQCLSQAYVDVVCIGEGEETIQEIAHAYARKTSFNKIKGIGYKENGRLVFTEPRPLLERLDEYEMDWSLLNVKDYLQEFGGLGQAFPYITSRGCPFSCGFCYNYTFNKRRWRAHSEDHVVTRIKKINETTGARWVFFDDDNFFANPKRALTILRRLHEIGVSCSFLEIRIDSISSDIIKELRALNVQRIFVGWESGSERMLKLVTKGFDRTTILEKCKIMSDFPEIAFDASAIIGFPTETRADIKETVQLAIQMAEIVPNIYFNIGTYLPYPGTKLYDMALSEGFVPPTNPDQWGDFDILSGSIKLQWLPWTHAKGSEIFRRIDRYSKLLNHVKSPNTITNIFKQLLYRLARMRMKMNFYFFPFEIMFYDLWIKKIIRTTQKS